MTGFFVYNKQVAKGVELVAPENLVQSMYDITPNAPNNKSEIIRNFCDAAMSDTISAGFYNKWFYYSPAKSVFLYMICKDFGKYKWTSELWWDDNIIKINKIWDLKSLKYFYKFGCDPKTRMTTCDFGNYYHLLYEKIINNYINAKLANAYGYINSNNIKDNIASFITKWFGDSKVICGWDDQLLYLNKTNIWWNDTSACSHPKTYKLLSQYILGISDLVDNDAVIDYQKIISYKDCEKITDINKDFLSCAIITTGSRFDKDANLSFLNIVQNEYFWYGLLNTYTKNYITPEMIDGNLWTDSTKAANIVKQEQYSISFFAKISKQSTRLSIDSLFQTIQKFPIHIALIAYLEDVTAYRNKLAQLYTPLWELHYKLQNVQNKQQQAKK